MLALVIIVALLMPASAYAAGKQTHRVKKGENLTKIAKRYGVSTKAIKRANGLSSGRYIYAGKKLVIPVKNSLKPSKNNSNASGKKWIEIDLSKQRLAARQGNKVIKAFPISSGTARTPTPRGTFRIYAKYRKIRMRGPGYNLPNVPHSMFFLGGYAIHGTYWHSNFGTPMSHGCVNLSKKNAAWLYKWAPRGTKVKVHR
jgi:lipoprotein-anchoring transpeptidase ErfK/SrfK